jgi:hypothetical protein
MLGFIVIKVSFYNPCLSSYSSIAQPNSPFKSLLVLDFHVATFDAAQSNAYNKENCEITRDLFVGRHVLLFTIGVSKACILESELGLIPWRIAFF